MPIKLNPPMFLMLVLCYANGQVVRVNKKVPNSKPGVAVAFGENVDIASIADQWRSESPNYFCLEKQRALKIAPDPTPKDGKEILTYISIDSGEFQKLEKDEFKDDTNFVKKNTLCFLTGHWMPDPYYGNSNYEIYLKFLTDES